MKKTWIVSLILFLIVFTACESNSDSADNVFFEVKLIEELCGNAVLQVVNPSTNDLRLESWTDAAGVTYDNVFSTLLPCNVDQTANTAGAQFNIEILAEPDIGECIRCLAILANMPEINYHIKVVD